MDVDDKLTNKHSGAFLLSWFYEHNIMLQDTIKTDLVAAMKAGDEVKKSVLRQLMTSLKNESISLKRDLTEDDEMSVVKREVKRLKEGMVEFEKADRKDLADAAKAELEVMEVFMPAQMSDEE